MFKMGRGVLVTSLYIPQICCWWHLNTLSNSIWTLNNLWILNMYTSPKSSPAINIFDLSNQAKQNIHFHSLLVYSETTELLCWSIKMIFPPAVATKIQYSFEQETAVTKSSLEWLICVTLLSTPQRYIFEPSPTATRFVLNDQLTRFE